MVQQLLSAPIQEGEVVEPNSELEALRSAVMNLHQRCEILEASVKALRAEVDPWSKFRRGSSAGSVETPQSSLKSAAWDLWKQKLPGYPAKFIDALLGHGELDSRQLSITTGCHYTNVAKVIYKLNQAGLVNKNGNRFSLKEL